MTLTQAQPSERDAVLGGLTPPPITGAVLGGLPGATWRLRSASAVQRVPAALEALGYGEAGKAAIVAALDQHDATTQATLLLLWQQPDPRLREFLQDYSPVMASEREVNYEPLQALLATADWQQADVWTAQSMLALAGYPSKGYPDGDTLHQFPLTDLRTIDRLWTHYSQGQFGFSIQRQLWQQSGMAAGMPDLTTIGKFGQQVGWRKGASWLYHSQLSYNRTAPLGHLPGWVGWGDDVMDYEYLIFGGGQPLLLMGWGAIVTHPNL